MKEVWSKRGYEFSFSWIFAIFIGGVVIFFAIYFAMQLMDTQQTTIDVTQGKSIGVLLTPIETELEEGKFAKIYLTDPTRIGFECEPPLTSNVFGSQKIRLSIEPPLGREWEDNQAPQITFHNKYFFASGESNDFDEIVSQGEKEFYVLSKPLYFPFKVADLLIIYSDNQKFCFEDLNQAPPNFQRRIKQINMTNIFLECGSDEYTTICFSGSCDIKVNTNGNQVIKGPKSLSYALSSDEHDEYAMLYAAIFSDPDQYECQVKRLMAHTSKLIDLYYQKSEELNQKTGGVCSGLIVRSALQGLNEKVTAAASSGNLAELNNYIRSDSEYLDLKRFSGGSGCELF